MVWESKQKILIFSGHKQLRRTVEKCIDVLGEYVKNDSICDIVCYFFIAKFQNFLIAPRAAAGDYERLNVLIYSDAEILVHAHTHTRGLKVTLTPINPTLTLTDTKGPTNPNPTDPMLTLTNTEEGILPTGNVACW